MADHQGTGRHLYKSSEAPYPYGRGESSRERRESTSGRENDRHEASGGESQDLKEWEYRDDQGNIHHHTHTAKEMKDK